MPAYNMGLLIREARQAKGLSQEKLAEGICSRSTIYGIERGTRKPDWITAREILLRLGLEPNEYYSDSATSEEQELMRIWKDCRTAVNTADADRLEAILEEMEHGKLHQKGRGADMYLYFKAHLHMYEGAYEQSIETALQYFRIRRPDFNIDIENWGGGTFCRTANCRCSR